MKHGVGGHLVAEAELIARRLNLTRIVVSTTNDNLPALYFYQRRGYRLTEVRTDAISAAGGPSDIVGFGGIPMRDQFRLEKVIAPATDVD